MVLLTPLMLLVKRQRQLVTRVDHHQNIMPLLMMFQQQTPQTVTFILKQNYAQ